MKGEQKQQQQQQQQQMQMKQKDNKEFHDNQPQVFRIPFYCDLGGGGRSQQGVEGVDHKTVSCQGFLCLEFIYLPQPADLFVFLLFSLCGGRAGGAGQEERRIIFWLTNRIKVIAKHTHSHVYAIARSRSPSRSSWRSKAIRIRPVDRTDSWLCDFSVYGLWTKLAGKACASVCHCAVYVCVCVSMLDHRLKLESLSALV